MVEAKTALIVEDDSNSEMFIRKVLNRHGYKTVSAKNGADAIKKLEDNKFNLVLTDWMMPHIDGIELIYYIRKNIKPSPIIIVITALAIKEAKQKAMYAGADDYIAKPLTEDEIIERIESCEQRTHKEYRRKKRLQLDSDFQTPSFFGIGVAASTGGPQTLIELFSKMRPYKHAAFFVVLHGPAWMLEAFCERLQSITDMKVRLAESGMKVLPGHIYLSPGDKHTIVNPPEPTLSLSDGPPENYVRPSADPLFRSIAYTFGKKSIGIVLTGMGRDGSIGAGYISAAGGMVVAQNPATAILPNMPQSVIDLKIAHQVIEVNMIDDMVRTITGDAI